MIGPLQDDGAAGLDRRQEADVERGRMPDRHADQVAVIAPVAHIEVDERGDLRDAAVGVHAALRRARRTRGVEDLGEDRKSTRLNSSHVAISYAGFCLTEESEIGKSRS